MMVFVDTSALLALLDADDEHHDRSVATWGRLAEAEADLVSTNYVIVETVAIVQHRLGIEAVRTFTQEVAPFIELVFVDEAVHQTALTALLLAGRRRLSLVDCVSLEVMRRRGLAGAYAYDRHFAEHGFTIER